MRAGRLEELPKSSQKDPTLKRFLPLRLSLAPIRGPEQSPCRHPPTAEPLRPDALPPSRRRAAAVPASAKRKRRASDSPAHGRVWLMRPGYLMASNLRDRYALEGSASGWKARDESKRRFRSPFQVIDSKSGVFHKRKRLFVLPLESTDSLLGDQMRFRN